MKNFIRVRENFRCDPPSSRGGGTTEGQGCRRNFLRVKEDFVCQNCGEKVRGDGYTDHCNVCLWGKHVDRDIPGDRASECRGLMEPIRVIFEKGEYKIYYRCQKCGYEFRVRAAKNDNKEIILKLCGT